MAIKAVSSPPSLALSSHGKRREKGKGGSHHIALRHAGGARVGLRGRFPKNKTSTGSVRVLDKVVSLVDAFEVCLVRCE